VVRCLISSLVCAAFYGITITLSFVSSPECAYLSPSTCQLLFMFLHFILSCPSSYCIPHAIIKCMSNNDLDKLLSLPRSTVFTTKLEDCSIRPLELLFTYLRIWNSLIRKDVGSFIRWVSLMRFHFDQESCCTSCNSLSQYLDSCCQIIPVMCPHKRSLSTFTTQSTYWLLSTIADCHPNTASVPLSVCHKAVVKRLPIWALLSWAFPLVLLCTAAFSFFFSSYSILSPFCL
jgi:hypothetical protein